MKKTCRIFYGNIYFVSLLMVRIFCNMQKKKIISIPECDKTMPKPIGIKEFVSEMAGKRI